MLRFELKACEEIVPWGNAEQGFNLHWFGLSDSYYWFEANGTELLRYSDEALADWSASPPRLPYVDYQFCRVYEDLGAILDDVLTPVPREVLALAQRMGGVSLLHDVLDRWFDRATEHASDDEVDLLHEDLYDPALGWLLNRRLGFAYLLEAPVMYFLRRDDEMHIHWDCEGRVSRGYEMWKARNGQCVWPVEDFRRDVLGVFDDFVSQMGRRVSQVVAANPYPGVAIDSEPLLRQQADQEKVLARWKRRVQGGTSGREVDWSKTVRALEHILAANHQMR